DHQGAKEITTENTREKPVGREKAAIFKAITTVPSIGDVKVEGRSRAIGENKVGKHDAESKRNHFPYAMTRRKSLQPAFSFWNLTPDPTPLQSPATSDCDTDEEGNMDRWSRPLSLA